MEFKEDPSEFVFSDSARPEMDTMPSERIDWIDAAKALAITLMVFGHVLQSLTPAGIAHGTGILWYVNDGIYLFHMPVFFFVSGYLFSANRLDTVTFFKKTLSRIAYPMIMWGALFISLKIVFNTDVNTPIASTEYFHLFYNPIPPYWFLYALFWMQVAAYTLLKEGNERFFLLASIGAFLIHFLAPLGPLAIQGIPENLLFFALGTFFAKRDLFRLAPPASRLFALVLFACAESLCLSNRVYYRTITGRIGGVVLVLLLLIAFRGFNNASALRLCWVQHIGRNTLSIFCMHTIFAAALRIILTRSGVRSVSIHLVLGTIVGVIGPLTALAILRKMNVAGWAGFTSSDRGIVVRTMA